MTITTSAFRLLTVIALLTGTVALAGCDHDRETKTTTTQQTTTTRPSPVDSSTTTTTTRQSEH